MTSQAGILTTGITIDEFELLPAALAKNRELVNGELVDVSGNTVIHNRIRDRLVHMLIPLFEDRRLGIVISEQEFDFDGNAHGPDVVLVGTERTHRIEQNKRVQRFVPDMAIEIVSTHDTFDRVMEKAARYRRCGTREVWVLAPHTRQAFIQSPDRNLILDESGLLETPLIPGFSIQVGQLYDQAL